MNDLEMTAALMFPDISKTPADYYSVYPPRSLRKGAKVTRFAPSPTGFLHIGGLFASLVSERLAHLSGGVFFLRIEDTDKKREILDGVSGIVNGLESFNIKYDEGMTGPKSFVGAYGPYLQSDRVNIYQAFAKDLVIRGLAYPCFCSEDELSAARERQEADKLQPGYYGSFAKCRDLSAEAAIVLLKETKPFTVRLKSGGREGGRIRFKDGIKGDIEMQENFSDIVLLKSDGIPTYHFAHAVDDTLMGTTDVVRGDEWIASVPVHLELFSAINKKPPNFAHISPIMKESEDGGKRKISKRKDPEAAVEYFLINGYPTEAVIEYLLTLANSNFEDWRKTNAGDVYDFPFDLKKMSPSGALFDFVKLNDVSKTVISRFCADKVLRHVLSWAEQYDAELYRVLSSDLNYALQIFSVDRDVPKPRKDIAKWSEIKEYISFFYEALFERTYDPPDLNSGDMQLIALRYTDIYCDSDLKDVWFDKIKSLCLPLGFVPDLKAFKLDPGGYKGHIGDVSNVIRAAITGRRQSPDLYHIMRLLGRKRVLLRLEAFISYINNKIIQDSINESMQKQNIITIGEEIV